MGKVQSKVAPKPSPLVELGGAEIVADNIPFAVAPPGTDQHLSARQPVLGVDSDLAVPRFLLHEKAKIGAEADILCLLLEHWDPLLRDEFDNLAIYYCSLYGHLRCCAWFLIAIGGTQNLPQNEIDRNIDNALHQGIKALFRGEQLPKGTPIALEW
jgi:hypothetical protein